MADKLEDTFNPQFTYVIPILLLPLSDKWGKNHCHSSHMYIRIIVCIASKKLKKRTHIQMNFPSQHMSEEGRVNVTPSLQMKKLRQFVRGPIGGE